LQSENNSNPSQKNLAQALKIFESLQVTELVNFFKQGCVDINPVVKSVQIDQVDPTAAVIYPIILADRLEVILSLPHKQPLRHYATSLPQRQIESTLEQLRQLLVTRNSQDFLPLSQQVYDWLIQPAESELTKNGIKTLVFVLDGSLRNIPMTALHDGKQYLVEKYAVAINPGLQLEDLQPLKRANLDALIAGVSEAVGNFPALTNVKDEVNTIKSEVPKSRKLLNQQFTSKALQKDINSFPFPVVHIASHGEFSSKANNTFILAWDGPINVKDLDNLLRLRNQNQSSSNPIKLLVLSACKTVVGDRQAALGLAGVAVRAGAGSTLATLWYINDVATVPLMSRFYQELGNANITKAEAIRRSQRALLQNPEYQHPVYWAPYVLVGNWL
jgi:CHAT domain-containing protein